MLLRADHATAHQASFMVSVYPTIAQQNVTVRLYNTYLASGEVRAAQLCGLCGDIIEDFTKRVVQNNHGAQDVELDVSKLGVRMHFIRIQTGVETATFKILILR